MEIGLAQVFLGTGRSALASVKALRRSLAHQTSTALV